MSGLNTTFRLPPYNYAHDAERETGHVTVMILITTYLAVARSVFIFVLIFY